MFSVYEFFDASKAGLAISQAMILTGMVQLGSQQATEVVNQMMSVERILEYTNLEKESSEGSDQSTYRISLILRSFSMTLSSLIFFSRFAGGTSDIWLGFKVIILIFGLNNMIQPL